MKTAKVVLILIVTAYGVNALAAKLVCGKVIDHPTGIERMVCAYIPEAGDARDWAFRMAFYQSINTSETSIGSFEYYEPFQYMSVDSCESARQYINNQNDQGIAAYLMPGFGCMTQEEIEAIRNLVIEKLEGVEETLCTSHVEGTLTADLWQGLATGIVSGVCALPGIIYAAVGAHYANAGKVVGGSLWAAITGPLCAEFASNQIEQILDTMCADYE